MKNQETSAPITAGAGLPDAGLAASAAALPATAVLAWIMRATVTNVGAHEAAVLDLARRIVRRRLGPGNVGNDGKR